MDFLGWLGLVALVGSAGYVFLRAIGIKPKPLFKDDLLDDPRVEWEVREQSSFIGATEWAWRVRVGDKSQGNTAYFKPEALTRAREAARRMLGDGETIGRTRPCALCGEPSRIGKETDTDQCADLLAKARAELAELPSAVI